MQQAEAKHRQNLAFRGLNWRSYVYGLGLCLARVHTYRHNRHGRYCNLLYHFISSGFYGNNFRRRTSLRLTLPFQ